MSHDVRPNPDAQSRKTRSVFYIVLLLLLVGLNVYLYLRLNQLERRSEQVTKEIAEDSLRLVELDLKYQEALASIESYKGQNASLDSLIALKERELMELRQHYAALSREKKLSEEEARKAINQMRALVQDLQAKVQQLEEENRALRVQTDTLSQKIAAQVAANIQLQKTNKMLATKAGLLYPISLTASGVKLKASGKENPTDKSKKSSRLKVCFVLPAVGTVMPGEKTFYVRIINPEGITLSSGNHVITKAEGGSQIQYTMSTAVDYEQETKEVCVDWEQSIPFQKGSYTLELYQDGYLVGKNEFLLK